MSTRVAKWSRRWHRWGAIVIAAPLLVVVATGLLLQLKSESDWVQPPTRRGTGGPPRLALAELLAVAAEVPEAEIQGWSDVDRIDVRPDAGVAKVRATNHWEVQIDLRTGAVLQSAARRSDWIEDLHDGSFFHPLVKLGVFLPAGVVLLALWGTGLYLFVLPHRVKRRRRERA